MWGKWQKSLEEIMWHFYRELFRTVTVKRKYKYKQNSIYLAITARKIIIPCSIFFPSIKNILHLSFAWLYYLSLQAFHWVHIKGGKCQHGTVVYTKTSALLFVQLIRQETLASDQTGIHFIHCVCLSTVPTRHNFHSTAISYWGSFYLPVIIPDTFFSTT